MQVDKRMIEPFNTWWRARNHCEADIKAVEAFEAGFKAGMERMAAEARALIESGPSAGAKP